MRVYDAHLEADENGELIFKPVEPLNHELTKRLLNGNELVGVEISDNRKATYDQLKKCFAMFNDISAEIGFTSEEMYRLLSLRFSEKNGLDDNFRLSMGNVSDTNDFITYIIEFCFEHDIPFSDKTWEEIPSEFNKQWWCMKKRECVLCGEHADYAHVETVGMGNDRSKIDHSKYHFMALCRKHHIEQHQMGIESFIRKYHIKPISLTREQCVELGIMSYKSKAFFEERENYLRKIGAIE